MRGNKPCLGTELSTYFQVATLLWYDFLQISDLVWPAIW